MPKIPFALICYLWMTSAAAEHTSNSIESPREIQKPLHLKWERIPLKKNSHLFRDVLPALPGNVSWIENNQRTIKDNQPLDFKEVECGDLQRFHVELKLAGKPSRTVSDCTSVASISPDQRLIIIEGAVVDIDSWTQQSFPRSMPDTGYVLAWSKDGRKAVLDAEHEVVIVTFPEDSKR